MSTIASQVERQARRTLFEMVAKSIREGKGSDPFIRSQMDALDAADRAALGWYILGVGYADGHPMVPDLASCVEDASSDPWEVRYAPVTDPVTPAWARRTVGLNRARWWRVAWNILLAVFVVALPLAGFGLALGLPVALGFAGLAVSSLIASLLLGAV